MPRTAVNRLFILDGGSIEIDQNRVPVSARRAERWLSTPVPIFLIQTDSIISFSTVVVIRGLQQMTRKPYGAL